MPESPREMLLSRSGGNVFPVVTAFARNDRHEFRPGSWPSPVR
jgi:hypothetical protein